MNRTNQNRERNGDGRYTYSRFDRLCTCGHTLGVHTAERVKTPEGTMQPCIVHEEFGWKLFHCDCECFKPERKAKK